VEKYKITYEELLKEIIKEIYQRIKSKTHSHKIKTKHLSKNYFTQLYLATSSFAPKFPEKV